MMPNRIQRQRTKGWRMPEGAVYVGRSTKWGNRFKVGMYNAILNEELTPVTAVARYAHHLAAGSAPTDQWVRAHIGELRGKDLACWCPLDQPCHADVLIEWANEGER